MMSAPTEHTQVQVSIARDIGHRFNKSAVVIWAHDPISGWMHVTTWGATAEDTLQSACLGELFMVAAGGDLPRSSCYEDFRTRAAAEAAQTIDELRREVEQLRKAAPC
jgi:hypothetical protein